MALELTRNRTYGKTGCNSECIPLTPLKTCPFASVTKRCRIGTEKVILKEHNIGPRLVHHALYTGEFPKAPSFGIGCQSEFIIAWQTIEPSKSQVIDSRPQAGTQCRKRTYKDG